MKKGFSRCMFLAAAVSCSLPVLAAEQVLLSDGGVVVTQEEYKKFLQTMLPADQVADLVGNDRRMRELLADYFVTSVLATEARKQGIDKEPEFVARQRFEEKSQLSQAYLDKQAASVALPDFTVKAKEDYTLNKQKYTQPAAVRAAHILIAINDGRDAAQAEARAKEVYEKAVKPDADFKALATEYSDDPSIEQNGGDLGFFTRDRMVKPFADAAFSMKDREISKPVKTQFGYHIIRKIESRPESLMPYNAVKDDLIAGLKQQYINNLKRSRIEEVRSSASIKFDQKAYDELVKSLR